MFAVILLPQQISPLEQLIKFPLLRMRFPNLYFVYIAVFFLIHLASSTTIKILNQNKLAILLMKHGSERTPAGSSANILASRQE